MIEPAEKSATPLPTTPGLDRRLLALLYEGLILIAVLMIAEGLFMAFSGTARLHRAYLFLVLGVYFTWFWTHGGQTVAMKTWRIRVEQTNGHPVTVGQALLRYMLAYFSIGVAGIGLWWAWIDRDQQFLHDRLAGTRLIRI